MNYKMVYYLKGQSELFTEPHIFYAYTEATLKWAVSVAKEQGYKILYAGENNE